MPDDDAGVGAGCDCPDGADDSDDVDDVDDVDEVEPDDDGAGRGAAVAEVVGTGPLVG